METKKILIVDDDIDIITIVASFLKKEGYQVITANDKFEAVKLAQTEKPDLAIIDVMMNTQYEGFELAKHFVESDEFSKMPVIMHTSVDVLTTTKPLVQAMAHEFRKDPNYKDLQVLLVKNIETGTAGVDYRSETGETVWFPVDAFVRKPVDVTKLIPEVKRLLELKK